MRSRRLHLPGGGLALAVEIALGWTLAGGPTPARLSAGGGDRPDASVAITGPIATESNKNLDIQVTKDAVYYLNYSRGRLLAAVPLERHTAQGSRTLSDFAERDLVRDFQLPPGSTPHFVMTTGTLGALDGQGWAPLYIFETTTGQLAIYRVQPLATSTSTQPLFQLLERLPDPRLAHAGKAMAAAR